MPPPSGMTAEPMETALAAVAVAAPYSAQVTATALTPTLAKDLVTAQAKAMAIALSKDPAKDLATVAAIAPAPATEKATATLMSLEMDNYARFPIGTSI